MPHDQQPLCLGLTASRVADLCLLGLLLALLALAWTGGERESGASVRDAARVAVQRQLGVPDADAQQPPRAVAAADTPPG